MGFSLPALGGCHCGQIRYRMQCEPLSCYICHCHLCQKRTGSAFSIFLVLPAGAVEDIAGAPVRTERMSPGRRVSALFSCADCYSRLWTERGDGTTTFLPAGTLDDTAWVQPVAQIWVSSAQPWAVVRDILTFEEDLTDIGAVRSAWKQLRLS